MKSKTKYNGSDLPVNTSDWTYASPKNLSTENTEVLERIFMKSVRFYRALLKNHLPSRKDAKILDLPCGEGRMIYTLRAMGYQDTSGYDLDRSRLEMGKKLDLPLYEGDVFEVLGKCRDNSIDCIISMDFLEHLEKNDVIHFLELTCRKITPGGVIIVRTPCADNPFGGRHIYNDFTHKWAGTSGVLRQLLSATGFSSVVVFGEDPNFDVRFGFLRVLSFHLAKFVANLFLRGFGQGALRIWTPSMWAVAKKGHAAEHRVKDPVFGVF